MLYRSIQQYASRWMQRDLVLNLRMARDELQARIKSMQACG